MTESFSDQVAKLFKERREAESVCCTCYVSQEPRYAHLSHSEDCDLDRLWADCEDEVRQERYDEECAAETPA